MTQAAESGKFAAEGIIVTSPQKWPLKLDSARNWVAPTARAPERIFGDFSGSSKGLYFPKGDAGTHMFGRGFPKLDGERWVGARQPETAVELGTSSTNRLRAYRSPSSPFLQYQSSRELFPKSRYWH